MKPIIPVSTGEVIDKITILEIKSEKIKNKKQLTNISRELVELNNVMKNFNIHSAELERMTITLKEINKDLWDIEDKIRVKEAKLEFDSEFIELARSVYKTNDKRAEIKKEINYITKSDLVEEKSYK